MKCFGTCRVDTKPSENFKIDRPSYTVKFEENCKKCEYRVDCFDYMMKRRDALLNVIVLEESNE